MDKIQIYYGVQGNGMTFMLDLSDYQSIKKMFPKAQPPKSIFVTYDRGTDFANYHPNLEKYVFPALMGFLDDKDLKKIKTVEFLKTPEYEVTHTIKQNQKNEQEVQPVSR